jgi:hypothetical protein
MVGHHHHRTFSIIQRARACQVGTTVSIEPTVHNRGGAAGCGQVRDRQAVEVAGLRRDWHGSVHDDLVVPARGLLVIAREPPSRGYSGAGQATTRLGAQRTVRATPIGGT